MQVHIFHRHSYMLVQHHPTESHSHTTESYPEKVPSTSAGARNKMQLVPLARATKVQLVPLARTTKCNAFQKKNKSNLRPLSTLSLERSLAEIVHNILKALVLVSSEREALPPHNLYRVANRNPVVVDA
jgi:hypothetical protein